ncbi:PREDICTED: prominin-1 isoform X3 [Myotis davidii]|uniref:prominin-1 isoform X3 n=1 Tax=Myotis davidii TaxID=225400 RepID=UPI0007675B83|nr:PREDICTED: prominin-1 isoform X3 [Myotis davidii]
MTLTLGVLLLLGLCQSTISEEPSSSPNSTNDGLKFQLPMPTYETKDHYTPRSIGNLFNMVRIFLYVVQPNFFPRDLIREILQKKFEPSMEYGKPESVVLTLQIIQYEIGILLGVVLGLLFVILMPLVGLCFGVCRCFNKCGGEMHQRQRRDWPFRRKYYALALLILCVIMSIGIIYGFMANHYLRTHIRKARKLADSNFRDLRTLQNVTVPQVTYVLDQFTATKERAVSDLDNIKTLLGGNIQEHVKLKTIPVLDDVEAMAKEIRETKVLLVSVNKNLWELKRSPEEIYRGLQEVKRDLEQSLKDPVCSIPAQRARCNSIKMSLDQLDNNTYLGQLRLLDNEINHVNGVLQTNLSSLVQMSYQSINNIPERVEKQTTDIIPASPECMTEMFLFPAVKRILNYIGLNIKMIAQEVPIREKLSVFLDSIDDFESNIYRELPRVEKYESYRWLSCLIICCFLTLIMIFYYLGLLCGVFGYKRNATPTTRGCVSNTGGTFLMVGVGISFFICWISMLSVVLAFVIGVNMEKLVCEPYQNRKLFQIMDTPYLLNENWKYYLSGKILNNMNINLTIEQVYRDCKDNKGIYTALQLENVYNVSKHLTIKEHIRHMNNEFKKMSVNLDDIILKEEGKRNLLDFSDSGVEQIDYDTYLAETGKSLTKVNLLTYASGLKEQANKLPPGVLKESLTRNVIKIEDIHNIKFLPLDLQLKELHHQMQELQQRGSGLKVKVTNILDALDSSQKFITNDLPSIIIEESKKYADIIVSYFEYYLNWANVAVMEEIAACKPVATAFDSAFDVFLCNYITKPMNLFWFGIGKATILLLPAIIIAVKLAKYYRRMDSEDVYEEMYSTASNPL